MMDPEMMRLAQEQMSKMSPAELARIQQQLLSNPNLVKLASESMKNMRADDFRRAAQQLNQTRPDEMLDMAEKLANANPDEVAAMKVQADQQMSYVISGAKMLKQQGNELHKREQYSEAAAKYKLAKDNLKNIPSQAAYSLQLVCTLNLMACYLKTRNFEECINEGSEVLTYDASNVKAYYRRGQAYKELGKLEEAVGDLSKAHELSPDDETIAAVLKDAEEKLAVEGKGTKHPKGVLIEEVTDEDASKPSSSQRSSSTGYTVSQPPEEGNSRHSGPSSIDANGLSKLGMQGMSPELVKTASDMIGTMKPEELQKMFQAASSLQGTSSSPQNLGPNMPEMSPEMFKMASDMIGNMSPDELQNMLNFASNMGGPSTAPLRPENKVQPSSRASTSSASQRSVDNSQPSSSQNVTEIPDEILSNRMMGESSSPGAASTADMQETMRNAMKDPAMRKMYASMMKNISPEMMSNISEQFGMKMSKEDAAKAQEALSSLSPEALDRMMRWMDRAQQGVEAAKKTKNWLLGRKGLVLAIVMLILAFILHQLGFIGG
uniref:Uncharacterized protein n=1 Tax=Leersia perrieri TaxID=77586 RepID=A0A0D9WVR0_9ORYZ